MASYYKNARRWQREHRSSGPSNGDTLTFARDKASGEFTIVPQRPGGSVPSAGGRANAGVSGLPANPPTSDREWKEYNIPSASRPGGLGRFRGIAQGALGWMVSNADELAKWDKSDWDRFMETGDLPEPFGFLNRKVLPEGISWNKPGEDGVTANDPEPESDGNTYWTYLPPGWTRCSASINHPGRTLSDGTYYGLAGTGGLGTGDCGYYGRNEVVPYSGQKGERYGIYTSRRNTDGSLHPTWNNAPYQEWYPPSGQPDGIQPKPWPQYVGVTPTGAPAPSVSTPPQYFHIPGGEIAGYAPPDPNHNVPARYRNLDKSLREANGTRWESGYDPDRYPWEWNPTETTTVDIPDRFPVPDDDPRPGPGKDDFPGPRNDDDTDTGGGDDIPPYVRDVVTRPSPPYKPPGKKPDRKAQIYGRGLFAAAQRGFHAITEYNDFIESFYDALPKKYQTCKVGGPACKTAMVLAHWDEVHIPTAVVNWVWNDFEDRMIGKFNAGVGKAAKGLGTTDWKLLNGYNESPLDEGLGELYGEFVKDHVNPTKKDFVAWAERNLF